MSKERIYRVTFEQHTQCQIVEFVFHCWAPNAPEAKRLARVKWDARSTAYNGRIPHMFHLEAHRADTQIMEDLRVVNDEGRAIYGWNTMWVFIATSTRTWRVNGINKYGPKAGLPYYL